MVQQHMEIHIDKLSDNWGWKQPIIIGISKIFALESLDKPRSEFDSDNWRSGVYGYDNFGRVYREGICNKTKKYTLFDEDNII